MQKCRGLGRGLPGSLDAGSSSRTGKGGKRAARFNIQALYREKWAFGEADEKLRTRQEDSATLEDVI